MEAEPLYESAHYRVDSPDQDGPSEGGYLFLFGPEVPRGQLIGSYYYQVPDIAIDPEERWCLMVGEGVLVYNLRSPWEAYIEPRPPYRPGKPSHNQDWGLPNPTVTDQWWEYRRYPPDPLQFLSVTHVEGERFEAISVVQADEGPTRWAILADSKVVKALNWLPDLP